VLLLPPGAAPDAAGVRAALDLLATRPDLRGIVEVPEEPAESCVALGLLLWPERVGAVLLAPGVLDAVRAGDCGNETLDRCRIAIRTAAALEVTRPTHPIAPGHGSADPDLAARLGREALAAFSLEDLFPALRTAEGASQRYPLMLDLASTLLQTGRLSDGFAVGSAAQRLAERRDTGVDPERLAWLVGSAAAAAGSCPDPDADPCVSLVLPTLNRPALLARALASVAAQAFGDLEVIVVNDGGRDPARVVEPFRSLLGGGGRLTLVSHDRNRGLAETRNTGLRLARGRWVGFLDDDDRLLPNHLAALVPRLELGARMVYADWCRRCSASARCCSRPGASIRPCPCSRTGTCGCAPRSGRHRSVSDA
jgi:hypothetical protein